MKWRPLSQQDYHRCQFPAPILKDVDVEDLTGILCSPGWPAIIDSGSDMTVIPTAAAAHLKINVASPHVPKTSITLTGSGRASPGGSCLWRCECFDRICKMNEVGNMSEETQQWTESFKRDMDQERAAFHEMLPRLLASHRGLFVALCEGKVIDQDQDELSLVKRVSLLPKDKFILIEHVLEAPCQAA